MMRKYGQRTEFSQADIDSYFSVERFQDRLNAAKSICSGTSSGGSPLTTTASTSCGNRKQYHPALIPKSPYSSSQIISNHVPTRIAIEHTYHSTRTLGYCNIKDYSFALTSSSSIMTEDDGTRKEIEKINSVVDSIVKEMAEASRMDWNKYRNHQISTIMITRS